MTVERYGQLRDCEVSYVPSSVTTKVCIMSMIIHTINIGKVCKKKKLGASMTDERYGQLRL